MTLKHGVEKIIKSQNIDKSGVIDFYKISHKLDKKSKLYRIVKYVERMMLEYYRRVYIIDGMLVEVTTKGIYVFNIIELSRNPIMIHIITSRNITDVDVYKYLESTLDKDIFILLVKSWIDDYNNLDDSLPMHIADNRMKILKRYIRNLPDEDKLVLELSGIDTDFE